MAADHTIKNRAELFRTLSDSGLFSGTELANIKSAEPDKAADQIESAVDLSGMSRSDLLNVLKTKPSLSAKKVTVSIDADAGEEVEVTSPQAAEPDEVEEMVEEDEPMPKGLSRRTFTKESKAVGGRLAAAAAPAAIDRFGKVGSAAMSKHKAYNRAAQNGGMYRGKSVVFGDAEQAEAFGAWFRTTVFPNLEYAGKSRDKQIVAHYGEKALGGNINESGGFALADYFSTDIIETLPKYGAARRAIGVTNMPSGNWVGPRITDDVDFAVVGEGAAASDQNKPNGDNVRLDAREVMGLVRAQQSWLADAAIDAADAIARSMARGAAKFEDTQVFLSRSGTGASPSFQGIGDKIGANTTHDAVMSAWGDFTVADDTTLRSKLSDRWAGYSERLGYVTSYAHYTANFEKLGLSAGGATPMDFLAGARAQEAREQYNADTIWNGKPVWFTPVMPQSYSDGQIGAYFGAWDIAAKLGEVQNSLGVVTSEDRYFEYGQTGFRMIMRLAFNAHDVNNDASAESGSLVVALQD